MKKTNKNFEMLNEYDFSKGARGKYAKRYSAAANMVTNKNIEMQKRKLERLIANSGKIHLDIDLKTSRKNRT
jgi:hypothetical protein